MAKKMKDLGIKYTDLYDNPTSPDDKNYPTVSLPASLFDKSYKVGDKCILELEGSIENMGKKEYRIKLLNGVETESAGTEKKESKKGLLASAKAK